MLAVTTGNAGRHQYRAERKNHRERQHRGRTRIIKEQVNIHVTIPSNRGRYPVRTSAVYTMQHIVATLPLRPHTEQTVRTLPLKSHFKRTFKTNSDKAHWTDDQTDSRAHVSETTMANTQIRQSKQRCNDNTWREHQAIHTRQAHTRCASV